MPAATKKKTTKKKVARRTAKKSAARQFVETWNKASKAAVRPEVKFKNRGGGKFTLSLNDNALHDIIFEEMSGMGGSHKVKGEVQPQFIRDYYRAVLFFMWRIPLDKALDKKTEKQFTKILARLKKEDPDLFKKDEEE